MSSAPPTRARPPVAVASLPVVFAILRRPDLWGAAIATMRTLAPRGWWRRAPYLPIPDEAWMHFRLETAYGGDGNGPLRPEDLVTFLEWKRSFPG